MYTQREMRTCSIKLAIELKPSTITIKQIYLSQVCMIFHDITIFRHICMLPEHIPQQLIVLEVHFSG